MTNRLDKNHLGYKANDLQIHSWPTFYTQKWSCFEEQVKNRYWNFQRIEKYTSWKEIKLSMKMNYSFIAHRY